MFIVKYKDFKNMLSASAICAHLSLVLVLAICCLFCLPSMSWSAFKSSKDAVSQDTAWNPHPLADDIILPMPCGLNIALRAVNIPSGSLIQDKDFHMGVNASESPDRNLYERKFIGHIAAPFTAGNLPEDWRQKLAQDKNNNQDTWYFIGKYEISRLQWNAVMNALNDEGVEDKNACPTSQDAKFNKPVTDISWFEVQNFLNKYNAWLIKHNYETLPSYAGTSNVAFFRLPTEEEWEYAARGGSKVAPEWWSDNDFFKLDDGKQLRDYGVFDDGTAHEGPASIGSRNANPLGLHDTAGNVNEMVDGFFRMSVADMRQGNVERRLHGAAGGILIKGGSFRSAPDGVAPGWRDEMPLYTTNGPGRASETGFRIVLGGINMSDADKQKTLSDEERNAEKAARPLKHVADTDTPIEAVTALEAMAQGDMKKDLQKLRDILADEEQAKAMEESKNLENAYRNLLYQAETLRAFAFRYSAALPFKKQAEDILKKKLSKADQARAEQALARANGDLKDYMSSLEMGTNFYKSRLESLAEYPVKELERLAKQTQAEYGGNGVFNEHMRQNIKILQKLLADAQKRSGQAINAKYILRAILPEHHYEILPMATAK